MCDPHRACRCEPCVGAIRIVPVGASPIVGASRIGPVDTSQGTERRGHSGARAQ